MPRLLLLASLLAVLAPPAAAGAAERRVPQGWLGTVADGPLTAAATGEWDRMVDAGVESVRIGVFWRELQPYPDAGHVPASEAARFRDTGGVPTHFGALDALVEVAARRGLSVLPVLQGTPPWAALAPADPGSPPVAPEVLARFASALVARYGPAGSLWQERPDLPRLPVRAWQVWNEPSLPRYWSVQPFAASYVALLREAERAIHAADPGATVVLAGLPNRSWAALREVYRAGGRGHFDAVALHPYTGVPSDVLRLVRRMRRVMRKRGDARKPLWITELSWPAAKGKVARPVGIEVSERGQAERVDSALRLLARARRAQRIARVFWYTWLSTEQGPTSFDWSGLRRWRGGTPVSVPALAAFRARARRLEGCAKAPGDARRCA